LLRLTFHIELHHGLDDIAMNTDLPRAITSAEIATYQNDGVVLLPEMFDADWIELLTNGLAENCEIPTDRSRVWDRDAEGRTMFWDSQAWQSIEQYRRFVFNSPAGQIAGELMGSTHINFFFDAFGHSDCIGFRLPDNS